MQKYVIIGTGGHAMSIQDLITNEGGEVKYFIGHDETLSDVKNIPVLSVNEMQKLPVNINLVFGIGNFAVRNKVLKEVGLVVPDSRFPPLVHSTSYVSKSAKLGFGTIVFAKAYVGPNSTVGKFSVLNTASSIDHDCLVGDQNFVAPGVIFAGGVKTGHNCFIGMGSLISSQISLGQNSVVAANSFVNENIPNNSFAAGTPAKLK